MTNDEVERAAQADRTIPLVLKSIAGCAAALAIVAAFVWGLRFGFGVAIGGAMITANFYVLTRVGRALTGSRNGAAFWGMIYLLKVGALFGGVFLLLHAGIASGVGIIVGLCSLVPGIVVGGLLAAPSDPTPGAGTPS